MSAPLIIDTHVHVWNRDTLPFPWLEQGDSWPRVTGVPSRATLDAVGVSGVILVEAGVDPDFRHEERSWLLSQVDGDRVLGVVAAAQWQQFDERDYTPFQGLHGVRLNVLGAGAGSASAIARAVGAATHEQLPVDVLCSPSELGLVARTLQSVPLATVIIDHLGGAPTSSPWHGETARTWLASMRTLALHRGAHVKLSGHSRLGEHAGHYFATIIELFGSERCLVGSDWPVSFAGETYGAWTSTLADSSGHDVEQIGSATAQQVYRL